MPRPDGSIPKNRTAPQATNGKLRNYARVYETFGVGFTNNGSQALADECPFCGQNRFYLNVESGQYDCKKCGEKGNPTTYLTWLHGQFLEATPNDLYIQLQKWRGIGGQSWQTFKAHELAYDESMERWLVPFKSSKENVVNMMLYYPKARPGKQKYMLPELPTALYGFPRLVNSKDVPVLLCEGPFDAIALDYNIGATNRPKYAIVAIPGCFKEEWVPHFKGRKVRALFDNDKGGDAHRERVQKLLGESGVADELLILKWPEGTPDGYDLNDLVRDKPEIGVVGFTREHSYKPVAQPKLDWEDGWLRKEQGPEVIDWVWQNRMRCGSYISYSGAKGTLKSTIMRELVARYTRGEAFPDCDEPGLPAGHVIYITAEDGKRKAWADFELFEADRKLITVHSAILMDGSPMNVLEHLDELRQKIRRHGTRLVVIDGQNSVVGAPNISTDMLARHNITNKLHQFAQKENICLVGVRNEDPEGRAYGPASMSDLSRGILRSEELPKHAGQRYFLLKFVRVTDAREQPDIPYSVEDLGGSARRILWGKRKPDDIGPVIVRVAKHMAKVGKR